eukprot:6301229-Pyramimonas_sp.AAC.1
MAGAPADSEVTIPATDEEIQLMLYHRVIGNPTDMELSDDDPLRGNPRGASDLSERIQYELGHIEEFHYIFFASDRSMRRQNRSASRQVSRKKYRADDGGDEWEDSDRMMRRGRISSRSPDRARARSSGARSS